MLKTLTAKNFTAFTDLSISWSRGLNIIVGENGTGKSQLLKLAYAVSAVSAAQGKSPRQTKDELQKRLADKLINTCRPESLGRLVSRQPGRNRCDISVEFVGVPEAAYAFSFATNSTTGVKLETSPSGYIAAPPIFIPTREMLSIFYGFISLYEDSHIEFDETYYDLAKALNNTLKKKHNEQSKKMIEALEKLMDGQIKLEAGRFYLHSHKAGTGKIEIPLVAEGMRKLGMLAYLLANGALRGRSTLFWDEPETNLNPRLMAKLAHALVELAEQGYQVILATHSLFMLRELEMAQQQRKSRIPSHFIGLSLREDSVLIEQNNDISGIQNLVLLDEELLQSDRYLELG